MLHALGLGRMSGLRLLAVLLLCPGFTRAADPVVIRTEAPATQLRLDASGDPLPPNALARFGTIRFRHGEGVQDVELSPNDLFLATMGSRLVLWDAATGRQLWSAEGGHANSGYGLRRVVFSPDSSKAYVAVNSRLVRVFDAKSGARTELKLARRVRREAADSEPVDDDEESPASIDLSSDGKLIALGGPQSLRVCDATGAVLYELKNDLEKRDFDDEDRLAPENGYAFARFSPDGGRLAVATSDRGKELRLHDARSGELLRTIELKDRAVQFAFSRDGAHLAASERDHTVRLYDVETGKRVWEHTVELKNPYENYTSSIVFSPDGSQIAVGATDHRIYILNAVAGERRGALVGHAWYPWGLAYSTDGRMLYSSGWEGRIRRWDTKTLTQLAPPAGEVASGVITMSRDGLLIAYAADLGHIRIIDSATRKMRQTLEADGTDHSCLLFSPDGSGLAVGGNNGDQVVVNFWDVHTGKVIHRFSWPKGKDPHSRVEDLAFAPDGRRLASAVFRQSAVQVFDLERGVRLPDLKHKQVYGLCFSPVSNELATAGWDKALRFWDAESFELRSTIDVGRFAGAIGGDDLRMYAVRFNSTGELLATAHLVNGAVRIWDAARAEPVRRFRVDGGFHFGSIAFSPDGRWLATGSHNGMLEVWNAGTGERASVVGRHGTGVYTLSFGADSKTLVTGGGDVGILWRVTLPEDGPAK
jgi:WD40 repeat protein